MTEALLDPPFLPLPTGPRRRKRHQEAASQEISYAGSATSPLGRAVIRGIENATGRHGLLHRAAGYREELDLGRDFWRVMLDRYGLRLALLRGSFAAIPARGPLVLVANHPFGILDGLVLGHILSATRRGDFRIMAHQVFSRAEPLHHVILPIDFARTKAAQQTNLATRAKAVRYLRGGGAVGVFPGGTVATAARPLGAPLDPVWRGFSARMIRRSGATVVPIWFDGANSRLFQIASHLSTTLRMALLVREFGARVDGPVRLAIGTPIAANDLPDAPATEVMDFLRRKTYELSPTPPDPAAHGHEFEARYRR